MKKTIIFGIILVVFSIFANACVLNNGKQTDNPETINSDTVLDDQLFETATSSNTLEQCDKILDEAKKEECKNIIDANNLTSQAVEKSDASICQDIKLDRYKENCDNLVNAKIEEKNKKEEFLETMENSSKISEEAFLSKDVKACDEIEDLSQKNSCKFNIVANEALAANDISLCQKTLEGEWLTKCEESFDTPEMQD